MEVPSKKGRKMVSAKFSHPNKREKTATMTETACFSCGLAFLHRIHYEDHIRVFHDSKDANLWRLCEDCGKTFSSEMALNDHRTDHDVVKILWTLESHDWSSEPALEASELQSTSAVAPSQFKRPHSRYGRRSSDTQVPTGTGRGVGRPPKKPKDPDYIPLEDEKDERMKLWRKPRIIPSMASQFPDGVKVHKKRGRPRKHPIVLPTEVKSEVISPIDMSAQTKDDLRPSLNVNGEGEMIKNQRKIPTPVGWIREKTGVSSPPTCTTAAVVSAGRKRKLSSNFFSESVKSLDGSLDHHSISDIVYLTDNRHLIPTLAALPVQRSTNGTLNDCPVCPLTSVPPSVLIQHMTVTHQGKLDLIEKVVNFQDERIPERKLVFDSDTCEFCSEIFPCKSVCLQHVMAIHEKDLIKCPAGAKTDIRIEVLLGQSVMSTGEKYNVTMSLGCPVKRTSMDGRANSSPPVYSL